MKKWQKCVLIWQNICLFWMIMKTWSGIEPCVLFWMQHWLVHWWHVKRRYSENYSLPSRERSTACTLLNCFQPHRNHPFHLKAWILWALNRRGQNEYRLEVVGLMWQMCETDSLRFIAFCFDNDDGDDDEHHDSEESLKTDPDLIYLLHKKFILKMRFCLHSPFQIQ